MSVARFAKLVLLKFPRALKNPRFGTKKKALAYLKKNSVKEMGVIPTITGLAAAPFGAAAAMAIPGTAGATAIAVAATTRGVMKIPSVFVKALKRAESIPIPKNTSIFTMK